MGRFRLIPNRDLSTKHEMQATGSLPVAVVRYSFRDTSTGYKNKKNSNHSWRASPENNNEREGRGLMLVVVVS
jgi:hypothetical protein